MKCPDPQCGVENAETARFCRSCGAALVHDRAQEPSAKQCPACGRRVPEQARFCGKCGCPIPSGPTENVEALIEPRRAPDPEPVPPVTADEPAAAGKVSSASETSPAVSANALDNTGTIGKPVFVVSVIAAIVVVGSIAFWFYFGQAAPSAADTGTAASIPSTPLPPAFPAPPEAGRPPSMPPDAAAEVTTGKPFDTLLTPAEKPQAEAAPTSEEEARAKAERARKRHRARLARKAAERAAREAALRNVQPPEPPPPSSVKELCAGEMSLFNRNSCEARNCQTKEWMFTSYCMQRRKLEDEKRRGVFGTSN